MSGLSGHLPVLQVVIPLMAAPVCVLLHRPRLAWVLATAVSWLAFGITLLLLQRVTEFGTISYALGGWAAPWGIEYRIDALNGFVAVIVAGVSAVVLLFARESVVREVASDRIALFYTCWLLCLTGLLGIAVTGDAFNLFVFLEISSLASYALISLGRHRRGLTAAYRYLIMGTIGATFFLIGIAFLYVMTGTLNMADLARHMPGILHTRTALVAFAFLIVGISLKMALFPLHFWLPDAYTYAPSAVSAFLAGTATKVSIYVLLRFLFTILGGAYAIEKMNADQVLMMLALAATFVGSLVALFQTNVKRLLAYSSVAQVGYIVLGISFASATGLTGGIVHLFNHALIKTALFLTLGCIFYRIGAVGLADFAGLGRRMPWSMAAFVAGGLSLIGVPLTAGFISKWYIVLAALERNWWPVAAFVLMTSLMAVVYVWRVVEMAYFRSAPVGYEHSEAREAPITMLLPAWVLIAASFYFGIDASLTTGAAALGAQQLLGTGW